MLPGPERDDAVARPRIAKSGPLTETSRQQKEARLDRANTPRSARIVTQIFALTIWLCPAPAQAAGFGAYEAHVAPADVFPGLIQLNADNVTKPF